MSAMPPIADKLLQCRECPLCAISCHLLSRSPRRRLRVTSMAFRDRAVSSFRPQHFARIVPALEPIHPGGVAFPERPITNGCRPMCGRVMGLVMADVSIVHARVSTAAEVFDSQSDVLAWILASAAMLFALMTPALWNGFPLIFPDTGGCLNGPILGALSMGRSALYGLFLYTGV